MAELAWLIPLFPLASWLFISLAGHKTKGQGDRVGTAAVGLSFLLATAVLLHVISGAQVHRVLTWAVHGNVTLGATMPSFFNIVNFGFQVDPLTAVMLFVVTLVSLLVHIYSIGYMHGDIRYKRFYAILSLFTFSMLGLVLADNFALLFIFWELVGLCSFLLIGHWFEKKEVGYAAMKAFLTTRVGDIGMLIGIMYLFAKLNTFSFTDIAAAVEGGSLAGTALTVAAVLIFLGAVGKSAQFPLHVWLPDAMAGPTSVSALIHAATMVAAGVYLVARAYMLFSPSPDAMLAVAWVGGITALFAASIGLVMEDIKKVLAYSTVSQLGFMMLGLGLGGYTAGVFHLTTHAFFKALLFLASGSIIHAVHTQNMHEMGGLRAKMPITFWTWLVGAGALAGIPPLAGFWSKDEIMLTAFHANPPLFWISATAALFTAFYITRATILTFFGQPRNRHAYEHAHESPATMTMPLIVLAVLAAVAGLLNSPLTHYWFSRFVFFHEVHEAAASGYVLTIATLSWLIGLTLAWAIYAKGWISRQAVISGFRPVWVLLKHKYYVDELYMLVFVKGTVGLAMVVGWIDRYVIDGIVNSVAVITAAFSRFVGRFDLSVIDGLVNGVGATFTRGSQVLRRVQTGNVQMYALAMFFTVVVGLLVLVAR